ncbi:MAG: MFS transporter [Spirochaetes bacterium]|nr:MFS transporter [Spirochaetota bacterium]MBU1079854.1 MFS transporter [Spirochaetota bacterium]
MASSWKRTATVFLGGQTLSLFGSMLVQYAITWHITMSTQSGAMMTISIVCGILPTFFVSPFGGVLADRFDRRKLMAAADSAIALTTLALALSFFAGYRSLWLLFVASAVRAVGAGIQTPAVSAFLPQIVPKESLTRVNAAFGSVQSIILLASPMAAGALMSLAPIEALFFIDVGTAAVAVALLLGFVRVPPHERAKGKVEVGYWKDLRDGFAYVSGHAYVKRFFLFCAFFYFLAAPVAFLTPLQVTRTFGNDVWRLTAIEIVFSAGMTLGGVVIGVWGGFKNRVRSMALSSFIVGATTLALGLVPWFWVYLAVMAVCGVSMPLFNTPATVLLQETVDESYLGRVFGVLGMISSVMMPLGMLVFGPLADAMPIEPLLVGSGAGIFALGFFLLGSKALMAAGASEGKAGTEPVAAGSTDATGSTSLSAAE